MNVRLQWLGLGALLAATVAGFALLYDLRLNQGDSFPRYSSLRADPFGTRGLYDGLTELSELRVTRRFEPLSELAPWPTRTILLAGFSHRGWSGFDARDYRAIDRAARSGSRVVIAMQAYHDLDNTGGKKKDAVTEQEKKPDETTSPKKKKGAKIPSKKEIDPSVDLAQQWRVKVETRWLMLNAHRDPSAPEDLPAQLRWGSDVFFRIPAESPWHVLYRRGGEPVLVERSLGLGSIVLASDAYVLSNEALQRDRAPALLTWLIGPYSTIEFDESHLGMIQDRGIAALARAYGLAGAFVALVIAAGLFIWNRMALFVPPAGELEEVALAYNQTAGLEALLRRALAPAELSNASVAEWRRTARPADIVRVEAALAGIPKGGSPLSIYNTIVRALRRH